jgi:protein-disulfide isomerase
MREFLTAAFERQDSLGKRPWEQYAQEAGVANLRRFTECRADTAFARRVEVHRLLGDSLQVSGTPTLIVNGWKFVGTLRRAKLDSVIRAVLAGKKPT